MSPDINATVLICMILYLFMIIIILKRNCSIQNWFHLGGFFLVLSFLYLLFGFPFPTPGLQSFGGGVSPIIGVCIIEVGVILGIVAELINRKPRKPAPIEILQPILASPIVLLPLYGTIHTLPKLQSKQIIWLVLLGFQNGWFWKTVIEKVKPKTF